MVQFSVTMSDCDFLLAYKNK